MRDADADAVARLLRSAFRQPDAGAVPAGRGPNLPLTGERLRTWRQAVAGAWVAEVAGYGPIGAVFAVVEPEAGWLAGLGVAPEFRGAGVGAALTDRGLAYLVARQRPVVGMEAVPTAVGAAALYARRGYRVADVTVRLRGPTVTLAAQAAQAGQDAWREAACDHLDGLSESIAPFFVARARAQPRSRKSFLLHGPGAVLLCDPDPLLPATGGSLDLRLGGAQEPHVDISDAALGAAARSALARGLAALEVDLALADGMLLQRLARLGLTPIASTVRLVNDPDAYAAWRRRNGPIARWSF